MRKRTSRKLDQMLNFCRSAMVINILAAALSVYLGVAAALAGNPQEAVFLLAVAFGNGLFALFFGSVIRRIKSD